MRFWQVHNLGRLGFVCGLGLALAAPCLGQVEGMHLDLAPMVGYVDAAKHVNLENTMHYGGLVGLWLNGYLGVEAHYSLISGETLHGGRPWIVSKSSSSMDQDLAVYGGNMIFNFAPKSIVSPFVLGGWQEAKYDANDGWPDETYANGPQFGAGVFFWPLPRLAVRAEVRDWLWDFTSSDVPEPPGDDWNHNMVFTLGLELAIGGSPTRQDADHDGVGDKKDKCPATPLGARVDLTGCPIDSDGDGVADGLDQCPSTPAGARVDASGCPSDTDGDGVPEGIDACPDTPAGVTVDAKGCPTDADKDGVVDGLDKCPNTPANARVDADGCPIVISEKEVELLDTGKITVRNINFDTGKWAIRPESFAILDEIGGILIQWPDLRVEIGGHTDSRGSDAMNQTLSEKRANSVRDYLLSKFPQLNPAQYTAVGYGENKPIADNKTETGLAKNRRVEFSVLNTEVLKKERARRQLLQK